MIWSFGEHEESFADEVVTTLRSLGLVSNKKLQISNGTFGISRCWIVRCRSVGLKALFDELNLGTNAGNKYCPILPDWAAKTVIGAWLDGDGSISDGTISGYSKSKWLIDSFDKMLLGMGICSSIKADGHTICISQRKDVEEVQTWTKRLKVRKDLYKTEIFYKSPHLRNVESGWVATVTDIQLFQGPRTVVAIETESGRYVANNILTHNCLPKDISALIAMARDADVDLMVADSAWSENLLIREKYDWEDIKGATTDCTYEDE